MASKVTNLWRSITSGMKGNGDVKGDFVPVCVGFGMIVVSMTLGAHTGLLQFMYSPGVWVNKKKRETIPEVVMPDEVVEEAEQFITKSVFRKVAHIQKDEEHPIPDPIRKDVFAHPLKAETLKEVGLEPSVFES